MPGHTLTARDKSRLAGVHPDLQRLVNRVAETTTMPFTVLEGLRTVARQRELVAKGASKTMNSRHLTGHAVDLAPLVNGKASWDWPLYHKLAAIVKKAAADLNISIEWGGDWRTFKDGPHWQLPWAKYPATSAPSKVPGGAAKPLPKEVTLAPVYTDETQGAAAGKAAATCATSTAIGATVAAEPLTTLAEGVQTNSWALSSGDYIQIAVALVVIGVGVWAAWRMAR